MTNRIFGREGCPYCEKAVKFFMDNEIPFDYIDVNKDLKLKEAIKLLGFTTVPIILLDNRLIRGYNELLNIYGIKDGG